MRYNRGSGAPIDLCLNISPLCETLLNALDIFKNTPHVSGVGQGSKGLYRLCYEQLILADLLLYHHTES